MAITCILYMKQKNGLYEIRYFWKTNVYTYKTNYLLSKLIYLWEKNCNISEQLYST